MKTKALRKKLTLGKETVSNLNGSQMKNVYGQKDITQPIETIALYCTETGICCTIGCPTECTCGTVDNICPCMSREYPKD